MPRNSIALVLTLERTAESRNACRCGCQGIHGPSIPLG